VIAVRTLSISTGLAASTVTPGNTALDASFTTPVIDACAHTDAGIIATQAAKTALFHAFIRSPSACH
jgi:hypothetical protein